jgi:hypothetical protein
MNVRNREIARDHFMSTESGGSRQEHLLMRCPRQPGWSWPLLMQKSTWPAGASTPRNPALVWITCTTRASSLVSRKARDMYSLTSGRAGSRPGQNTEVTSLDRSIASITLFASSFCSFERLLLVLKYRVDFCALGLDI